MNEDSETVFVTVNLSVKQEVWALLFQLTENLWM